MNNIKTSPYNVISAFPLPIYKTNIEREFTKQEQDEFDVIVSEQSSALNFVSGPKNISEDKYLLNRKSLLSIHSFIQDHLKQFAITVLGIDIRKTNWSPHITFSWLNIYEPTHNETPHNHQNAHGCIISGVFYINCLKNLAHGKSDGIVFFSPTHNMIQDLHVGEAAITENTKFSDNPCHISTVDGDLVLFPSTTFHAVNYNKTSDQKRISLAFNAI